MEDRFRFRAWVKEEEEYFTYFDIFDVANIEDNKNIIIQQSTGLKDKNEKLIYEYDVVRFGQEDEDIGIVMWNEDECKFVINEEFNKSLSDFSNLYGEDLEILGNIFEHDFFGKDTTAWLKASNIL